MYIFIDESGIHKKTDHSTFVLVYLEINNYPAIRAQIEKVESNLGIKSFHWADAAWPIKKQFIEQVIGLDFKIKIAVIENPVNSSREMERILPHLIIERNIEKVFIDGKKPKWYERKIKKILRDKMITVKKLKTVEDESEAGVRLADMMAGLTRWHFDNKNEDKIGKYYEKLEKDDKIIIVLK
jgi:hypothetical protein